MQKSMRKIMLQDVRGSFVFLKEPRISDKGENQGHSIQALIPKKSELHKKILKLQEVVMKEAFGSKIKASMVKLPLRDGDDERDLETNPECEGMMFMNCNNKNRKPGIVNRRNEPADIDDLEDYCYSGAYFHLSVNLYAYEFEGKKGVAVGLNNVMLRKKGDRLDGSVAATSEFEDFAEDDDESEDDEW